VKRENMDRVECCSTHCERVQECRSPHECCGNAKGKMLAAFERARKGYKHQ
jgi:hypothetical protein